MTGVDWTGGYEETAELEELREDVRRFADAEIRPRAARYDKSGSFHAEIYDAMRQSGLPAACFEPDLGGTDGSTQALAVVLEELGRADISSAVTFATTVELAGGAILLGGTAGQRQQWLPAIARGELLGSYAIAEPGSGSDVKAMETVAVQTSSGWRLTGRKKYVTNVILGRPGFVVVVAKLHSADRDAEFGAFIVPFTSNGIEVSAPYEKMAWRGTVLVDLGLTECDLPHGALIGEGSSSWDSGVSRVFELGRIGMAAIALGAGERCFHEALRYADERVQFGRPIGSFQSMRMRFGEMATELEAARLLVYRAARLRDDSLMGRYGFEHGIDDASDRRYGTVAHMAKLFASGVAHRVTDGAVQVFGGKGLTEESVVGRFYRDQRMFTIGQGTTQIEKLIIGRAVARSSMWRAKE